MGKNLTQKRWRGPTTWKAHAQTICPKDTASWQTRKWSSYTEFQVLAWMIINSNRKNLNQLENYYKCARKLYCNACTWHELEDQTFCGRSTKLARAVTKWTQACDRRLARLISCIHHTSDFRQYVDNTAQHCRLALFHDSDFAADLEDSKSTSGRVLCIFGSTTFLAISWMCKKQTSVSLQFYRV